MYFAISSNANILIRTYGPHCICHNACFWQQSVSKPLLSFSCICKCAKETALSISPDDGVSISSVLKYVLCIPVCILVVQQNVLNCLQNLCDIDHSASVTGYNDVDFDVSWDLIDQGAYMTYCWLGPCQGPDANFGELVISCIA